MLIPEALIKIGFNKRTLSFKDCEAFCAEQGLLIIRSHEPDIKPGLQSYTSDKTPYIWIEEQITGVKRDMIAWHEITHALIHPVDIQFFSEGTRLKIEHQANIIAVCCVIPRPVMKQILKGEMENEFPRELWQFRCEAATRYGL